MRTYFPKETVYSPSFLMRMSGEVELAECRSYDPEFFYPDANTGGNSARKQHLESRAKEACFVCVIRERCLRETLHMEQGLSAAYRYGIFGATTPEERAAMSAGSGSAESMEDVA